MIYELRVYHVIPGRKPALLERFRGYTMSLFERHGIEVVGFWETEIGASDEVTYLCRYPDLNARNAAWAAFRADPEWQEAVRVTEASGPIVARVVNHIWTPVDISPLQ